MVFTNLLFFSFNKVNQSYSVVIIELNFMSSILLSTFTKKYKGLFSYLCLRLSAICLLGGHRITRRHYASFSLLFFSVLLSNYFLHLNFPSKSSNVYYVRIQATRKSKLFLVYLLKKIKKGEGGGLRRINKKKQSMRIYI